MRTILPNLLAGLVPARPPRIALPPVARWRRIACERRQLAALSDWMLDDIGITRAQVAREAARPFWDVPPR